MHKAPERIACKSNSEHLQKKCGLKMSVIRQNEMKNKLKQTFLRQRSSLYIVVLALLSVLLTSFTFYKRIDIAVRFVNMDEHSNSLKLEFKTTYPETKRRTFGGYIEIFKSDTLYIKFVTDSVDYIIDSWTFPSIPNGYKIVYPESTDTMLPFKKDDKLKFIFYSSHTYSGRWEYKPFYSNEKARWLFDVFGNQKTIISGEYERWLFGKDIIIVKINENFPIESAKFQLFDDENNPLEFELKYKKNPTNIVALRLNKKEKKGKKLRMLLNFGEERYYEEEITVPDRSVIGIAGKYSRL